jgi:hypothetical protein
MRIRFQISGGIAHFPGLAKPVEIETGAAGTAEAAALRAALAAARFFALPPRVGPERPIPDARTYLVTVEDEGRCHSVEIAEPITDPALQRLVQLLRQRARAARR